MISLGLTKGASATDIAIQKKICKSGVKTLIISNEEMSDIMETVKSLKDAGLLIQGVSKQLKMKQKNKKVFLACY